MTHKLPSIDIEKPGITAIYMKGYGDTTSMDGEGSCLAVDHEDGEPVRVLIYSDINQEDPTHIIDISVSLESNRKPEDS